MPARGGFLFLQSNTEPPSPMMVNVRAVRVLLECILVVIKKAYENLSMRSSLVVGGG